VGKKREKNTKRAGEPGKKREGVFGQERERLNAGTQERKKAGRGRRAKKRREREKKGVTKKVGHKEKELNVRVKGKGKVITPGKNPEGA